MAIDEVVEKSTIEFIRDLTLGQAEDLIEYMARELPANINYKSSYHMMIDTGIESSELIRIPGTSEITGRISHAKEPFAFDSFVFKHSIGDSSNLSALQFQLTPDWELADYRPEVRQLWDDVRKIVKNYFEKSL